MKTQTFIYLVSADTEQFSLLLYWNMILHWFSSSSHFVAVLTVILPSVICTPKEHNTNRVQFRTKVREALHTHILTPYCHSLVSPNIQPRLGAIRIRLFPKLKGHRGVTARWMVWRLSSGYFHSVFMTLWDRSMVESASGASSCSDGQEISCIS